VTHRTQLEFNKFIKKNYSTRKMEKMEYFSTDHVRLVFTNGDILLLTMQANDTITAEGIEEGC
jgi:hypothetical protein